MSEEEERRERKGHESDAIAKHEKVLKSRHPNSILKEKEELITEWKSMQCRGERENTDLIQPVIRSTNLDKAQNDS